MEQLRLGLCECGCGELAPIARRSNTAKGHVKGEPVRFILGHANRLPEARARSSRLCTALGRSKSGPEHYGWKGENADYTSIHQWMERHHPKIGTCEECGETRKTEWSNTDHMYRRVREDWRELCISCHRRADGWSHKMWATRRARAQANRRAPT